MRSKVQRWGNSLAVRIPKAFAEEVGLADESSIEMRLFRGGLVIEPAAVWSGTLDELVDGITDDNVHTETDWGSARGKEAW